MNSFFMWPVLWYLRFFAKLSLSLNHPQVIIGVAGSVGKSSTRNALHALLQNSGKTVAVGNSETGIPLGIVGISPKGFGVKDWLKMMFLTPLGIFHLKNTRFLIVEMGIDDPFPPKNMEYLLTIIKPHICLIINESAAHTQQFEKLLPDTNDSLTPTEKLDYLIKKIAEEDTKMITDQSNVIIYNADNNYIHTALRQYLNSSLAVRTFGKDSSHNMSYKSHVISEEGTEICVKRNKDEEISLSFPYLLPKEYQEVLAAALLVAFEVLDKDEVYEKAIPSLLTHFSLPKGRSSVFKGMYNTLLIDSTYNASKVSVLAFLDLVAELKKQSKRKIVFVFGDMRELGKEAKVEHEEVAKKIVGICDTVYCVGPLTKEFVIPYCKEKGVDTTWFESNVQLAGFLKKHIEKNSVVLFKGSQNTIFLEEAVKHLLEDKQDIRLLCRQDDYWLAIKRSQNRLVT